MDIAVVGVGASVTLDGDTISDARVSLGAVAITPLLTTEVQEAIIGKPANDETYKAAGEVARSIITPISDMRGTREFRIHVTGVLVERVLREAVHRAKN